MTELKDSVFSHVGSPLKKINFLYEEHCWPKIWV